VKIHEYLAIKKKGWPCQASFPLEATLVSSLKILFFKSHKSLDQFLAKACSRHQARFASADAVANK